MLLQDLSPDMFLPYAGHHLQDMHLLPSQKTTSKQKEKGPALRRPAGVFCGLFWLVLLVLVSIYGLYLRADFSTA